MRFMRNRAGLIASVALLWHVLAVATVSAVMTCGQGFGGVEPAAMSHGAMSGHEGMAAHEGMAGHEGMADCPMQKKAPVCPMHGSTGSHKCDCPTMGCSQTDTGFMALFGSVGTLPDSHVDRRPARLE